MGLRRLFEAAGAPRAERRTLVSGGLTRSYSLFVPPDLPAARPAPLVLVFHGGGGDGPTIERLTGFSRLAGREGFIAVYPDGLDRHWNDGRDNGISAAHRRGIDDVRFCADLLDQIGRERTLDPTRVYAAGMSNGGVFCHTLAARLSGRLAAIAPVVGGLAESVLPGFKPERPVSVFVIQGTADPIVPFGGGEIRPGRRGRVLPTPEAVSLWVRLNGCRPAPETFDLPDADPNDGCRVRVERYTGGVGGNDVLYYRIEGGGHTWPGGLQYLARAVIGPVCRDFDATEAIWEFFRRHSRG